MEPSIQQMQAHQEVATVDSDEWEGCVPLRDPRSSQITEMLDLVSLTEWRLKS